MNTEQLEKLKKINEQSVKNFYSIDELDWDQPSNRDILWVPEEMNYISYLPSYSLLTQKQKIRVNQIYAMSVCEQFVWLENNLLAGILTDGIQNKLLVPEFRHNMNTFFTEEEKHSEMFWRVLEKCEPTWYKNNRSFKIFKLTKIQDIFFSTITKYNHIFLVWIWLALFFEERTLDFSKKYHKAYQNDKSNIDFNLWQVHYYHMKDEIRHHNMDEIFLTEFYDTAPMWKRKLCGNFFFKLMKAYLAPKRNARVILDILTSEYTDEKTLHIVNKIKEELPLLETHKHFQEEVFGKESIGRTLELMATYPEFDNIWNLFIADKKSNYQQ